MGFRSLLLFVALCFACPAAAQSASSRPGILQLRATYGERGAEITHSLYWRIYSVNGTQAQLIAQSDQARPSFSLQPGEYAVHASHGVASLTRQLTVEEKAITSIFPLNVGELVVNGYLGTPDAPLPTDRQKIAVFIPTSNNSEGKLVTDNLNPNTAIRLPEGMYHLVSTYVGSNSVIRSDVKIETGKVTQASVNHRAATMTLKLVRVQGGVALAGVQWTIETPGGDLVADAVGAFPQVHVAEGSYSVLARFKDRDFRGTMKVEGGLNRDFEIVVGE